MKFLINAKKGFLADKIELSSLTGDAEFEVKSKKAALGREIVIRNIDNNSSIKIKEKSLSLSAEYQVIEDGKFIATLSGTPKNEDVEIVLVPLEYKLVGNLKNMTFNILSDNGIVGSISQDDKSSYEVEVEKEADTLRVLSICLSVYCLNTGEEFVYGGAVF